MKVQGLDAHTPIVELPKGPEAAEAFEAYLIGFLSKQMREAVPDGPLNAGAAGMFAELFDQEIGKRAAAGQGIGLRAELELALERVRTRVTSCFGERRDPIDGSTKMHDGLDLGLPSGAAVRAERAGVVSFAGERGGYGDVVIIDHGAGLETRYAHCSSLGVKPGDRVGEGAVIATVGSTGRSTGPHLHIEVRQDGVAVDPENFVRENR